MSDLFTELIVTRKPQVTDLIVKAVLLVLTVLAALAGLFINPVILTVFLILVIADYLIFPRLQVEYEYSYVNGEIDIAAVYSKKSRKELASLNLNEAECIAPLGSHHLDSYGSTYQSVDYSAKDPADKPYVLVLGGEKKQKVCLQLDSTMLKDLKYRMPMKVFTD